jgi:hypothetical protein
VTIGISTMTGEIIVTDNGPGIATATIDGILDYTVRVSSREAYPSPSRGRQGNALSALFAIPFALDGSVGETVIEARRIRHLIRFSADLIRQKPRVCCERGSSTVKNGIRVTVRLPAKAYLLDGRRSFLTVRQRVRRAEPASEHQSGSRRRARRRVEQPDPPEMAKVEAERSNSVALALANRSSATWRPASIATASRAGGFVRSVTFSRLSRPEQHRKAVVGARRDRFVPSAARRSVSSQSGRSCGARRPARGDAAAHRPG